jgi:hypothetical protein
MLPRTSTSAPKHQRPATAAGSPVPRDPQAPARIRSARPRPRLARRLWLLSPLLLLPVLGLVALDLWSRRLPLVAPRHRAEALCFVLAQPRAFDPPMRVEPSAALVRGRFTRSTPAAVAVQDVMHFSDLMVVRQWKRHVGDYDVCAMWLRLPEAGGVRFWLIVAWMEGADLAVCSFRFAGDTPELSDEQLRWGQQLLRRALVPRNFDASRLPDVKLRTGRGGGMPSFGPGPRS